VDCRSGWAKFWSPTSKRRGLRETAGRAHRWCDPRLVSSGSDEGARRPRADPALHEALPPGSRRAGRDLPGGPFAAGRARDDALRVPDAQARSTAAPRDIDVLDLLRELCRKDGFAFESEAPSTTIGVHLIPTARTAPFRPVSAARSPPRADASSSSSAGRPTPLRRPEGRRMRKAAVTAEPWRRRAGTEARRCPRSNYDQSGEGSDNRLAGGRGIIPAATGVAGRCRPSSRGWRKHDL